MGLGQMSMTRDEFYEITLREWLAKVRGYSSRIDQQRKDFWEGVRMVAHAAILPHSKKKIKPTDIVKLPWDKSNISPPLGKEELQELIKKWQKK